METPISLQCSEGGVEGVVNMPEAKGVFGRVDSQLFDWAWLVVAFFLGPAEIKN